MTTKNEYEEIAKALSKVTRTRMDPLSKLFLIIVISIPILIALTIYLIWKLCKKSFAGSPSTTIKPKPRKIQISNEKPPAIPSTDTIYYEVKKVRSDEYSLTQYALFFIIQNEKFVDVTKSMQTVFPEIKYYNGRSVNCAGTAVLTDYDIIQLKRNLGKVNLVRTVGDN